jgi:hypothetical protein
MSAFGSLHIAKVNLAAAVPHRVRRALGLGMSQADIAVGLSVIVVELCIKEYYRYTQGSIAKE